jgi:hypothetical protein
MYLGFEVFTAVVLKSYSTTLRMEAIRSSETSGTTQRTTRRHIPEEDTLQECISSLPSLSPTLLGPVFSNSSKEQIRTVVAGLNCIRKVLTSNLRMNMKVPLI